MYTPENLESGKSYQIPHPSKDFSFLEPVITISKDRRSVSFNWPTKNDAFTMPIERFCIEANLAAALTGPRAEQLVLA